MAGISPIFDTIAIIGVGLIGSSIARACQHTGAVAQVVVYDAHPDVRAKAGELNLGSIANSYADAVKNADCVIVCVPVGACGVVAAAIAPHVKAGAIITDVGSVKGSVIAQMQDKLPAKVHFIPGHPIAGTEYSGPEHGLHYMFDGRWCILTPLENTDAEKLAQLTAFWQGIGAKVECMTPEHHDLVLAITSHLPHLIAFTTVGTADDLAQVTESEVIQYSAGGFRDFTRLAASDPTMWRDVFLHNKDAMLQILARFKADLATLEAAIEHNDGEKLFEHFSHTRAIRRSIVMSDPRP